MTRTPSVVVDRLAVLAENSSEPPIDVTWNDLRIRVYTPLVEVWEELTERLTPFFGVGPGSVDRDVDAAIHVSLGEIPPPDVSSRRVMLRHSVAVRKYVRPADVYESADAIIVRDLRDRVTFGFRRETADLSIIGPSPESVARSCRRVVQDLVRLAAWRSGAAIVEAAAVAWRGAGLVVVGGPGAGKTTLLARLLSTTTAAFIANDEVMLVPHAGAMMAVGAPVHVMVRPELARRHPVLVDLAVQFARSGAAKQSVHYADFAARFSARIARDAEVRAVLALQPAGAVTQLKYRVARDAVALTSRWTARWDTPWRALWPPSEDDRHVDAALDRVVASVAVYSGGRDVPARELMALVAD